MTNMEANVATLPEPFFDSRTGLRKIHQGTMTNWRTQDGDEDADPAPFQYEVCEEAAWGGISIIVRDGDGDIVREVYLENEDGKLVVRAYLNKAGEEPVLTVTLTDDTIEYNT